MRGSLLFCISFFHVKRRGSYDKWNRKNLTATVKRAKLTSSHFKLTEKSRSRDPKILERAKKEFLPERYLEDYLKVADHLDDANISKIIDSVFCPFEFKNYGEHVRILFLHGTKGNEKVSAKAAKCMKEANPQTEIRCFQGYAHAQLASFEIDKWIREVASFLDS